MDTHLDVHVAAALDPIGGVLGVGSFPTTARGYQSLLGWLEGFGAVERVGVEGTGAYGAGLARFLGRSGIEVVEVDRPNRQARRQKGKSDPEDAVEAARGVLSGRSKGRPKTRTGKAEAIRVLLVAKRSAREGRLRAVHQMRQISYTAPEQLRSRLKGLSTEDLVAEAASMRPRRGADPVDYATKVALVSLGRRALELGEEAAHIDSQLAELVEDIGSGLLGVYGIGIDTAATLLAVAGDNAERLHSEAAFARMCGVAPVEASSGKVVRHRLNRGRSGGQPGAVAHRHDPPVLRPAHPGLHGSQDQGRPLQARSHQDPQAIRRSRGLPAPASLIDLRGWVWPSHYLPSFGPGLRPTCRPTLGH